MEASEEYELWPGHQYKTPGPQMTLQELSARASPHFWGAIDNKVLDQYHTDQSGNFLLALTAGFHRFDADDTEFDYEMIRCVPFGPGSRGLLISEAHETGMNFRERNLAAIIAHLGHQPPAIVWVTRDDDRITEDGHPVRIHLRLGGVVDKAWRLQGYSVDGHRPGLVPFRGVDGGFAQFTPAEALAALSDPDHPKAEQLGEPSLLDLAAVGLITKQESDGFKPLQRITTPTRMVLRSLWTYRDHPLYADDVATYAQLETGTVQKILARLADNGWADSELETTDPSELGRPRRRYYRLNDNGIAATATLLGEQLPGPGLIGRLAAALRTGNTTTTNQTRR